MNVILQGTNAVSADIAQIVALIHPQRVTPIAEHAWQCEDIALMDDDLREKLDVACQVGRYDYALIETPKTLADFRLLAMDMDSTLITIECIDEIADMQGLKPQVAKITEAAMRGEIAFRESLERRVALLKGIEVGALQRVYDERLRLSTGAAPLLKAVQAAGLKTLLVSGGFTFFTDRMKDRLQLTYTHANVLGIENGKLTGKLQGIIVDAEEKRATVERTCQSMGISPSQVIVMGDGANDLLMMEIAGLSVAFRAKPVVRKKANVALNFVGLDGVLTILHGKT